jgi:hypothetical protein
MTRSGPHKDDPPPFEPLPDNIFSRQTHPSWHDAYARCTRLFFWAVGRQPPPGTASYDMCSRVLGHLVLEAPTERGRDWVCKRILNCPDEQALARLAQKFIFTFIGACASSASPFGRVASFRLRLRLFLFSSSFILNDDENKKSRLPQDSRCRAAETHPTLRPVVVVPPPPDSEGVPPIRTIRIIEFS